MSTPGARDPVPPATTAVDGLPACCVILLVSPSLRLIERIVAALRPSASQHYRITPVTTLEAALTSLAEHPFAVLLLDLILADRDGPLTLATLVEAAPATAILILVRAEDEPRASSTLRAGVQDYVLAADLDAARLPRMISSAMARQHFEEQSRVQRQRAIMTLDSIGDAVLSTDIDGRVTYLNRVAETMTGWRSAQARGRPLAEVFTVLNEATRQPVSDPLQRAMQEDRAVELAHDSVLVRRDGHEYLVEDSAAPIRGCAGELVGAVIVFRDVGGVRATARDLAHLAHHDVLTDLPNRLLFGERVASAIVLARRHQRQAALLYLDLDGFKRINDSLGHALGDQLLLSVTRRLVHGVRASDTVCRQGGDEFVVLLSEIDSADDAAASAGKLLRTLAEPHVLDDQVLTLTASIGIALYPRDGRDAIALLRSADVAMYKAKRLGRNQMQFFTTAPQDGAALRPSPRSPVSGPQRHIGGEHDDSDKDDHGETLAVR